MRSRTFQLLRGAFSVALVACREKGVDGRPVLHDAADAGTSPEPKTGVVEGALPIGSARGLSPRPPPPLSLFARDVIAERRCPGSIVARLLPKSPVDYLELRVDPKAGGKRLVIGKRGTPCTRATDRIACLSKLEALEPPDVTFSPAENGDSSLRASREAFDEINGYFVYSRGDEIGAVGGRGVPAFLAPIESAEEAAVALIYDGPANTYIGNQPTCAAHNFTATATGFTAFSTETAYCTREDYVYEVRRDGTIRVDGKVSTEPHCTPGPRPIGGRRPSDFGLDPRDDAGSVAGFFAGCAEMETASIHAFRRLASELFANGAPRSLRRRATSAACDEANHARTMRSFARRFGATPRPVRPTSDAPRELADMAVENAVAGCVGETWAALLAMCQAEHTVDPDVRAAMRAIARDETRHAALAWDVAAWLDAVLDPPERALVRSARVRAAAELRAEPAPDLRATAGLPCAAEARALFDECSRLWS